MSARDIRRVVTHASAIQITDRANMVVRALIGLRSAGVVRVLMMRDTSGLAAQVMRTVSLGALKPANPYPAVDILEMPVHAESRDTALAVQMMIEAGVSLILVLGGDGTHRIVAAECGRTPLVALSTGTNNAFPQMFEPTLAGLAGGLVAVGMLSCHDVCRVNKILHVTVNGTPHPPALVDVAVSRRPWVGSRALWSAADLECIYLCFGEPTAIGLSSLGGLTRQTRRTDPWGLRIAVASDPGGASMRVRVPLAPGLIADVDLHAVSEIQPGQAHSVTDCRGTIAIDGEREIEFDINDRIDISLSMAGPITVDLQRTMQCAARMGLFVQRPSAPWSADEYRYGSFIRSAIST